MPADRLVELLDEVSELAHLKDGRIKLTLRSMSLRSVLNQAVQAVEMPEGYTVDARRGGANRRPDARGRSAPARGVLHA